MAVDDVVQQELLARLNTTRFDHQECHQYACELMQAYLCLRSAVLIHKAVPDLRSALVRANQLVGIGRH